MAAGISADLGSLFTTASMTPIPLTTMECSTSWALPNILQVLLLITILPPLYYLHADYKAFTSLGPGGTPSSPTGYLKIKILSLFALKNPYLPDDVHPHLTPGVLKSLPLRQGPRPLVAGIAPHRQVDQRAGPVLFRKLSQELQRLASEECNKLAQGTSCFEKHGTGLFSLSPIMRTCRGEICHVHPSDGSMHMTLHPADAKILLESGWGERHPLSGGGWLTRFVPREFVMVYAPRDEADIETVLRIVCASAWWVGGERVDEEGRKIEPSSIAENSASCRPQLLCACGSRRLTVPNLAESH